LLIQQLTLPYLLENDTVFATAPTGSGKTLAFLIPLFHHLKKPAKGFIRGLIIVPTRELSIQIKEEAMMLLNGNKHWKIQILEPAKVRNIKNIDVGISTPGKMLDILKVRDKELDATKFIILDECDRLINSNNNDSLAEQLDGIFKYCTRKDKKMMMFSATCPDEVLNLVKTILHCPIEITIGNPKAGAKSIQQKIVYVANETGKVQYIKNIKNQRILEPPCLIFCNDKKRAKGLFHNLVYDGLQAGIISSNMTNKQREIVVNKFRNGELWTLITTDLLARGVDIQSIKQIINYDLPKTKELYIHRIGRAGRGLNTEGHAITLLTEHDLPYFQKIAAVLNESNVILPDIFKHKFKFNK